MFVHAGGLSHVCVFGAHCAGFVQVDGHVSVMWQLSVAVVLHLLPHAVATDSRVQQLVAVVSQTWPPGQHVVPHVTPPHTHVFAVQVSLPSEQLPQLVCCPVPLFVSVPQFPPGAPASAHTGGPLQKKLAPESGPPSAMQSWPPGQAVEQSIVLPQPSSSAG